MDKQEELAEIKRLAKGLPGKVVALSPKNAFFSDAQNQYTLYAYGEKGVENSSNRVKIQEGWKLYSTMVAIRYGLLRVLDDSGKDVTADFGGPGSPATPPPAPIVKDVPQQVDAEDAADKKLAQLLNQTVEADILKMVSSRNFPYEDLERLLELEKKGENPTFAPRRAIVDGIEELMKKTPGLGRVGRINDEADATITTRKV